jgi:hypothetical protein
MTPGLRVNSPTGSPSIALARDSQQHRQWAAGARITRGEDKIAKVDEELAKLRKLSSERYHFTQQMVRNT